MKFLTQEQFTEMWKLQDELNTTTSGANWKELNQNWNLAIKSEVMEFFDYIGWKWWKEPSKTQKPSDMQARLELVDIWHFFLSGIIQGNSGFSLEETFQVLADVTLPKFGNVRDLEDVDSNQVSVEEALVALHSTLLGCDWTWDELYKAYIGKVALNNFRQNKGYKEGTYQKVWDVSLNREDNYFLEHVMKLLSEHDALTYSNVYDQMELRYSVVPRQ